MMDGLWTLVGSLSAEWAVTGVRGALLLSAAGAASLLLARAPAALRHLVWLGASVGLLLLPAAGIFAPRWSVPLPGWMSRGAVEAAAPPTAANSERGVEAAPALPNAVTSGRAEEAATAPGAGLAATAARNDEASTAPHAAVAAGRADEAVPVATARPDEAAPLITARTEARAGSSSAPSVPMANALAALFLVWALGVVTLLASLARSLWAVRRLERCAPPFPEGRVTREAARLGERLGIRAPVTLLCGPADAMPLSWGIRQGRVFLPDGAERWHAERLRSVLLHELAHVRRRDCLVQLVAEVARAIHWLDPLAWLAVRRLKVEREHACDDRVLTAGAAPSVYASELLSLARGFRARPRHARAAVAMAGVSSLEARLRAVLDGRRRRTFSRARGGAVAALALVATVALAGATPANDDAAASARGLETVDVDHVERDPRNDGDGLAPAAAMGVEDRIAEAGGPLLSGPLIGAPLLGAPLLAQEATCGLATDGWNSHSHHIDNDDHRLQWSRRGCSVDVRVEGRVAFTADFRDVASLERGARLRIEEEDGRTERMIEITPDANGRPAYTYEVDGDERAFDAAARGWYEAMLLQVFRKGGFMARERVDALLASGGPQAVIDELELISSDHVFATYVEELLRQADLDDQRALALMERARQRVDSDHYLAGILEVLAEREPLSDRVLSGLLEASGNLDSDHYRSGVLSRALQRGDLSQEHRAALLRSAAAMDSDHYTAGVLEELGSRYALEPELRADYLRTVSSMDSDHYRASVLSSLMRRNDLEAGELATVLQAAGDMSSDHYVGGVLEEVADRGLDSPELRDAYFEVAARMDSDHYRTGALQTLLEGDTLSDELVRRLIEATSGMESDHYKSGLLVDVAEEYRLEGATREAYMRAMDSIESRHSRGQVAEALLRQDRSGGGAGGS